MIQLLTAAAAIGAVFVAAPVLLPLLLDPLGFYLYLFLGGLFMFAFQNLGPAGKTVFIILFPWAAALLAIGKWLSDSFEGVSGEAMFAYYILVLFLLLLLSKILNQ